MSFSGNPKPKQIFQISSSHQNANISSSNSLMFAGNPKPKQTFQISSQSIQPSTQSMTFEGKPKQQFQISHNNVIQPSTQSMTFAGVPKPKLEISHGNSIQQSSQGMTFSGIQKPQLEISHGTGVQQSSQGITFAGVQKPKQVFEITSSHGTSSSNGTQGISFIAEKPKLIPTTNSITFEGKEPVQKSDPSQYKISSNNGQNNSSIGISFIAPERKPLLAVTTGITFEGQSQNVNNNAMSSSSQGFSYTAPVPPEEIGNGESKSISIKYVGDEKQVIKKKSKHYAMEFDAKYKKSDPKDYKIVNKVNDLFFKAKYEHKPAQHRRAPPSVKAFFCKKGKRRRRK